LEIGELVPERTSVNVRQLVGEAVRSVEPSAASKKVELKVNLDPSVDAALQGSARRIRQVCWLLIVSMC
jgi:signal transduction histidine kinase